MLLLLQLRITVWSLVNKTVSYIKYPKQCPQGMRILEDHSDSVGKLFHLTYCTHW